MKAIFIHEFGGPEVLKFEDIPMPIASENQMLVRIKAAGVNPADTYARTGNYVIKPDLPFTPGTDGAGIVESTGKGVTKFKAGDRVYIGRSITGTYAEYTLTLESQVHRLPDKISFSQGAGVYVPYGTAYHALFNRAAARGGESVLIHGASGGVGIAAIQISRALGLTIIGTAGSSRGLDLVKNEGAHFIFDHTRPGYQEEILKATEGKGVDIILEMLANVNLGSDLKLISNKGRIVIIGSRGEVTITPRDLMFHSGTIHAMTLWAATEQESIQINAGIIAGLENGTLRPVVGKELPLANAEQAHRAVMEKGAYGKIVLIP